MYRTTMMIPDGKHDYEIDDTPMMQILEQQYFPDGETIDMLFAIVRHYTKKDFSILLAMHSAYQLGRIHGKRAERQRKHKS